ncbi:MAG: hypothetical protein AB1652_02255 [Bacillota bacterium]
MNVFGFLLGMKSTPELRLTLLVLAKARDDAWIKIDDQEMVALTGLSATDLDKGTKEMLARGFVLRRRTREGFEYRVPFSALGIAEGAPDVMTVLKPYFTRTGFLDLMPEAVRMAWQLGYGPEEIIEAICKVADKEDASDYTPFKLAG